jgi:hypothetical protein
VAKTDTTLNVDVRRALNAAIEACVNAATDAETCKRTVNPKWHDAVQIFDAATDEMRALLEELNV